jgi:hypothetical protein
VDVLKVGKYGSEPAVSVPRGLLSTDRLRSLELPVIPAKIHSSRQTLDCGKLPSRPAGVAEVTENPLLRQDAGNLTTTCPGKLGFWAGLLFRTALH